MAACDTLSRGSSSFGRGAERIVMELVVRLLLPQSELEDVMDRMGKFATDSLFAAGAVLLALAALAVPGQVARADDPISCAPTIPHGAPAPCPEEFVCVDTICVHALCDGAANSNRDCNGPAPNGCAWNAGQAACAGGCGAVGFTCTGCVCGWYIIPMALGGDGVKKDCFCW
jgi:hypothetical protein